MLTTPHCFILAALFCKKSYPLNSQRGMYSGGLSALHFNGGFLRGIFQSHSRCDSRSAKRYFSSMVTNDNQVPSPSSKLSHIQEDGKLKMVDVSVKSSTVRTAMAEARVSLGAAVYDLVLQNRMQKGDVVMVARLAGILAAKNTSNIIPLCHNITVASIDIKTTFVPETHEIVLQSYVKTTSQTGVEMEALTSVSVAALTVYDMCKAVSKDITISNIHLLSKTGGKEDFHRTVNGD